ncbi:MAG: PrsW family intramembrane metalloprotease, partial [Planctomycetes bacterium]|nr:PrsW family intramembrane metalloprotease [Planctomycetota bacterium]
MPHFECECGYETQAPPRFAGKTVKCPKCGRLVKVPDELKLEFEKTPEEIAAESAAARRAEYAAANPAPASIEVESPGVVAPAPAAEIPSTPPPPRIPAAKRPAFLRWILAAALIPLAMSIASKDDFKERFTQTLEHNPDALKNVTEETTREELLDRLPGHRIEGAYAAEDSKIHWMFALMAAAAFWGFLHFAYPRGNASPGGLWGIGLFTGTVGIFLLLAVQWCAAFSGGTRIWGRGIVAIIMLILKFIGFSYNAALNPENGFLLSMFGFTFGVGLCEELCKAIPLLWSFRRARQLPGRQAMVEILDLNGAVTWGLAAGIGFGVSEGIHYAGGQYNGISTGGIYVVRFVSCVALHAAWSGASA